MKAFDLENKAEQEEEDDEKMDEETGLTAPSLSTDEPSIRPIDEPSIADIENLYMNEIGASDLLDVESEFRLALCSEAKETLQSFTREETETPTLSDSDSDACRQEVFSIYTAFLERWNAFLEILSEYDQKRGTETKKPDLSFIAKEARLLAYSWKQETPSPLRSFCDNGVWGKDSEWEKVVGVLIDAFLRLYLLPDEQIDFIAAFSKESSRPLPSAEELSKRGVDPSKIKARFDQIISQADEAAKVLVRSNLRLVVSVAKRYKGNELEQDLVQEGNIGLLHAVKKFDPRRGYKFATYAIWWIRQSISRYIAEQSHSIRIPAHTYESANKLRRIASELWQELGHEPSALQLAIGADFLSKADQKEIERCKQTGETPDPELQRRMNAAVVRVQELKQLSEDPLSLQDPISSGEDDEDERMDLVPDDTIPTPNEEATNAALKEQIQAALDVLSDKERDVLELRYGLKDGKVYTLKEVSEKYGLTAERVRIIESTALRRLRHPGQSRELKEYLS